MKPRTREDAPSTFRLQRLFEATAAVAATLAAAKSWGAEAGFLTAALAYVVLMLRMIWSLPPER